MSDVKQVKVDNWGIYFLQRLKHFFNRTDYCDLTLQFQDNAQLKVHRLVLSACTEYFELLERTCEMYEDCLVMPDDLQADVVVPIINFMYTGQLEFKLDLLEKLYQTSLVMNMPVLTKLLASHRSQQSQSNHQTRPAPNNYYGKRYLKHSKAILSPSSNSNTSKRNFSNAFENSDTPKAKKPHVVTRTESQVKNGSQEAATTSPKFPIFSEKNKHLTKEPRPTRYELPEELDEDNIFDNSFMNISYASKPLMVHPETTKQYTSKRIKLFEEGTSSRFMQGSSNTDIVECKKISANDSLFIDDNSVTDDNDTFQSLHVKDDTKDASQLFDQIIDNNDCSNITIQTKNNKQSGNLDHAKIISEVLKKYPHLVKSNKQIKLKILNTPNKPKKTRASNILDAEKDNKAKNETPDFTYETDVFDSKDAARLIALGAENIRGPWICLICGTPGKALHFTSYFNFRKHLVDIHNEKPVPNICEYCGLKSQKRNYLVHHQLTKHGVEPPSHYNFPKCNFCKYVALNEALMVKHKLTHAEVRSFRKNVSTAYTTSNSMLDQVQKTGNKYGERKHNLQCIYCLRIFLRENNLYAHLKTNHKEAAKNDGLIDDSDEEIQEEEDKPKSKHNSNESANYIKVELPANYDNSFDDNNVQYQIERRADGNIHVVSKKPRVVMPMPKHKILNPGFVMQQQNNSSLSKQQKPKSTINTTLKRNEFLQELSVSPTSNVTSEEIVLIDNHEYIVQDFQLIPKKEKSVGEYIMTNTVNTNKDGLIQSIMPTSTSVEYHNIHNSSNDAKVFVKKSTNANQPIQIVVSNEEEYKALVSNQSVIFEDGDSNKALTVLAPGTSSLETATIDLDNAQSNDMMIIQDEFSINVSDPNAANNSNIVVVYSHPVEDQNKQYQIITTQAVEAQFVPSSAIITQNYETVTTCAPVVSAHTALDNSWQNNIQTNINKLPITSTETELHTMTVAESVTIAPESDSTSNINDFSEVPITTSGSVPININQVVESQNQTIENNFNESNVLPNITEDINNVPICEPSSIITLEHPSIITDDLQKTLTETNIQQLSSTDLNKSTPINTFINTIEEPLTSNTLEPITENTDPATQSELGPVFDEQILVQENQTSIADNSIVNESTVETNTSSEPLNENIISEVDNCIPHVSGEQIGIEQCTDEPLINEKTNAEAETLEEPAIEMDAEETIENIARDIGVNPNASNKPELPKIAESLLDNPVAKVAIAQIENLASEWSEDESETLTEGENKTDKSNLEAKNDDASEMSEVEESIENIQQEMAKQVSVDVVPYTDEDMSSSQDDNLSKLADRQDSKVSEDIQATSKEKITLLLNDWDDNDSQEDNTLVTCDAKINDHDEKPQNTGDNDGAVAEESEISKNDNIKSLVSDWDEDDEENKE
ncbi:centrosome-associated zinc finger protein CP190 [Nymphalis io]|uniref:centrosome-associated zinc finger protein CP190 n=1 Tax=Inachis io TaxID=171585 RepID=UPI00216814F1|nr:centrosome-associated zinc finger protein CP190 [Nymphalis io]